MKHTALFLLLFGWIMFLPAQNCLPGYTVFTTQAQVDSFPVLYPTCTRILGSIRIMPGFGDTITDLGPFLQITRIDEHLWIDPQSNLQTLHGLHHIDTIGKNLFILLNPGLSNLDGLNQLKHVGGKVEINLNANLTSLYGLNQLESIDESLNLNINRSLKSLNDLESLHTIGKGLYLSRCDSLVDLTGLETLTSIGTSISISDNAFLSSLDGLDSITAVPESVYIFDNPNLSSLSGLDQLESIGAALRIDRNASLPNFSGLQNLKSIGAYLQIQKDSMLTSMAGLEQLTSVGGNVLIDFNPLLTDLTGLSGLTTINGSILDITENISLTSLWGLENIDPTTISKLNIRSCKALSYCELPNICAYLDDPDSETEIYVNADNCKNRKAIEDACEMVALDATPSSPVLSIFPNPVQDILTIETDRGLTVRISNILGETMDLITLGSGTHHLDWSLWPAGVYFLQTPDRVKQVILHH